MNPSILALVLLWAVNKGDGYASPAIAGDRLILFHRLGDEEVVDCLNAANGQPFWRHRYPTGYRELSGTRLFAAAQSWSAPVLNGGRLYICQNVPGRVNATPPRLLCYNLW